MSKWQEEFIKPLERHEIARLQQLSALVDDLWQQHTGVLARDREATEDPLSVWPVAETHASGSTRAAKEAIRKRGLFNDDGDLATPFRRLKLVMDYWCALWFWPIPDAAKLPSRDVFLFDLELILKGSIQTPQPDAMLGQLFPDGLMTLQASLVGLHPRRELIVGTLALMHRVT